MASYNYNYSYKTTRGNTVNFSIIVGDESSNTGYLFSGSPQVQVLYTITLQNPSWGSYWSDTLYINGQSNPGDVINYTRNLNLQLTFSYLENGPSVTDSLNKTIVLPEEKINNTISHKLLVSNTSSKTLITEQYTNSIGTSIAISKTTINDMQLKGFKPAYVSESTNYHGSGRYELTNSTINLTQYLTPVSIDIWYIPESYSIEYYNILETDTNPNPSSYTILDKIELQSPIREGYKEIGWTFYNRAMPGIIKSINLSQITEQDISQLQNYTEAQNLFENRIAEDITLEVFWAREGHQNVYLCEDGKIYANDFILYPVDKVMIDSDGNVLATWFFNADYVAFDSFGQLWGTCIIGEPSDVN